MGHFQGPSTRFRPIPRPCTFVPFSVFTPFPPCEILEAAEVYPVMTPFLISLSVSQTLWFLKAEPSLAQGWEGGGSGGDCGEPERPLQALPPPGDYCQEEYGLSTVKTPSVLRELEIWGFV